MAVCSTIVLPRARQLAAAGAGAGEPGERLRLAVEKEVDVAVRRRLDAREAVDGSERAGDLLGDGARRLAQPARQLEGERHGEIAERAARRDLDGNRREDRVVGGEVVKAADGVGHAAANAC